MDHSSIYMHVEHQLRFSASEIIIAKHKFKKFVMDHGSIVYSYLADNGIFAPKPFSDTYMNISATVE